MAAVDESIGAGIDQSAVIHSLVRGLSVIKAFDANHARMTLSDVAKRTGLSRATARRILHTLASLEYIDFDGKVFSLRPRVLELGYSYLSSQDLPQVCMPHLKRLAAEVNESCSVAVLDGTDIVYVARVATRRIMTVTIAVGTRFPAHLTSMGRVLLAGLDADRRAALLDQVQLAPRTPHTVTDRAALDEELNLVADQGWALVDQELEEGLRSVAVPLHDGSGATLAAINVSASIRRGTTEDICADLLPPLQHTAAAIESDLAPLFRGR